MGQIRYSENLELSLSKPPPRLVAPELSKALKHPTRAHALSVLHERVASPKELARELDRSIRHITYHLGILEKLGCVELVRTEPVMGGRVVEHFYTATKRAWLDRETWIQLDSSEQRKVTATVMELVSGDIEEAMSAGTFEDPPDNHLSRTPMQVDDEGWEETLTLLDSTVEQLLEIQARITNRSGPDTDLNPVKVEILHFRSPKRGETDQPSAP
jgi:DNA-binding transcriptional ArsR family regulator